MVASSRFWLYGCQSYEDWRDSVATPSGVAVFNGCYTATIHAGPFNRHYVPGKCLNGQVLRAFNVPSKQGSIYREITEARI